MIMQEGLKPQGVVELIVTKGTPRTVLGKQLYRNVYESCELDLSHVDVLLKETHKNIIVNIGKDAVIASLTSGLAKTIARMAIGDQGALPSDQTIPKTPGNTQTALFHEVFRSDIDVTVLNIGTPTIHQVKFTKTFSSALVPITAFSNQANPIINEVGLITADLINGTPLPRTNVSAPSTPPADEALFSIRAFNSIPFLAANQISITVNYTIFIE